MYSSYTLPNLITLLLERWKWFSDIGGLPSTYNLQFKEYRFCFYFEDLGRKKKNFLKAVPKRGKGLAIKKKLYIFGTYFEIFEKVPTAIKLEGGWV